MDLMWIAVYEDESNLQQWKPDGTENKYSDIERDRLTEFHLIDRETQKTVYAMAIDSGQRLIYRKRVATSGLNEALWTIFMVGWQQTVAGQNVQSIAWIFPDGSVISTGKFRPDHRLFYGIELLDFEDVTERVEQARIDKPDPVWDESQQVESSLDK